MTDNKKAHRVCDGLRNWVESAFNGRCTID